MPNKLLPSRFLIQRVPAALEAIRRHYCDFGCSPSFAELAARIGVSVLHVGVIVRRLQASGEIGWTPGKARSITLPELLNMHSTSALMLALQQRGVVVSIAPAGAVAAISAWPEAMVVESVPKVELELLARLDEMD